MTFGTNAGGPCVLNFGHWDLFEIWFLVLGISMVFIDLFDQVSAVKHLLYNKVLRGSFYHGSPSGMKLLMQIFEVFAGDMGIYLSRRYIHMTEHYLHGS